MKDIRPFHLNWIRLYIRFLTSKNRSFDKFLTNKGLECVGNNQLWMVPVWHSKEVMLIRVTHLFYNIIFSSGKWSAASAAVFNSLLRTLQFFCCSNKYSKRFAFLRAFLVGFFKSRFPPSSFLKSCTNSMRRSLTTTMCSSYKRRMSSSRRKWIFG